MRKLTKAEVYTMKQELLDAVDRSVGAARDDIESMISLGSPGGPVGVLLITSANAFALLGLLKMEAVRILMGGDVSVIEVEPPPPPPSPPTISKPNLN